MPVRLVQTNSGNFYLGDLDEIRYFNRALDLSQDTHLIDDERWETAKRCLKREFGHAQSWEICRNIILNFEQVYSRKYHSDWTNYLLSQSWKIFIRFKVKRLLSLLFIKRKEKNSTMFSAPY